MDLLADEEADGEGIPMKGNWKVLVMISKADNHHRKFPTLPLQTLITP